uniref:uncharacterized protein LOC109951872 n=1 Tax=Monopterus albus TaxID=43700 RepID=UPI0009B4351F|nr:uncharacterized protein LOC109951872 [Monopterus albus]
MGVRLDKTIAESKWCLSTSIMEPGRNEIVGCILERVMTRIQWALEQSSVDLDYLEYVCNQEYILLDTASRIFEIPSPITEGLIQLGRCVTAAIEEKQGSILFRLLQGERGSPKFEFSADFLTYLFEILLPVKCVANLLSVSESTIFRRMKDHGISTETSYSSMSDQELDDKIADLKARAPHAGYRVVKGLLQDEGHRVQWHRIKGSMHRIDSAGVFSQMTHMGRKHMEAPCSLACRKPSCPLRPSSPPPWLCVYQLGDDDGRH